MMKTKYYYIHGLNSSKNSRKFFELSFYYKNIECLEWNVDDNIHLKIAEWKDKILSDGFENTCIISSSTGSNFAFQLIDSINHRKEIFNVMINPLLHINYMFNPTTIPLNIKPCLVKIKGMINSLILIGGNDSVIDNDYYFKTDKGRFIKNNNTVITASNVDHDFKEINEYVDIINIYIKRKTDLFKKF